MKSINNKFIPNKIGSVVIGLLFFSILIFFLGSEIFDVWEKVNTRYLVISIIVVLILKYISFMFWYLALQKINGDFPFKDVLVYGYAITITMSIVMLDYLLFPNNNISALYTLIVPFGWFIHSVNGTIQTTLWTSIICSALFFYLNESIDFSFFLSNRVTSLVVILMVGVILRYFKINKSKLNETNRVLNQKIIEAESKGNDLEQFVYTVSHDLKEPLRSLSVILDIFSESNKDILKEDDNELLGLVKKSTSRMGRSIQAMLDYSKLGEDYGIEEVEINKVINDVIFEMDDLTKPININFNIENLGILKVYLNDFQLLFTQLIDNAIRYRKQDITCEISISRKDADGFAIFYIKDNGIGIEDVNHERIFKIFQSLEASENRKGIGLAHCNKITDLHKGSISVDSSLGNGSTFIVKISKELI